MLHPVTFRRLALAACGCLLVCEVAAVSLGEPRGAVLLGRPLAVTIPAALDGADADGACASAELFDGETRVATPPSVRWAPGPNGREGVLRIASAERVSEPVLTLNLRVGCGASVATRRYQLLSEPPSPSEPSAPLVARQPPEAARPAARAPVAAAAQPSARPSATAAAQSAPSASQRPERGNSRRQARSSVPATAPAAAAPRSPVVESRLRLTPLDIGPEHDPVLHFARELTLPGSDGAQARAAAAALWQATRRTPEEMMEDGLKLQALSRDIASLREQTQQNAAAVNAMRGQVQKARIERNQVSMLALVLAALLLAAAGWLLWRWRQAQRLAGVSRWFEANRSDTVPAGPGAGTAFGADTAPDTDPTGGHPAPAPSPAPVHPHLRTAPLDVAATRAAIASWRPADAGGEFQPSLGGALRMVGVRELLDVHDKAHFFLSIGQPEQAAAVLESHIHDQVETSALAWLDLLQLYHTMGRRADFERLRSDFRQRFTAQVPDFERFGEPTGSLENYSRALSRIVALWPSRRVLEVIEETIFRKPGLPGAEVFSLEAYRELVLLYHIALEVAPPQDSASAGLVDFDPDFNATSLQSLGELDVVRQDSLDVPLDLSALAPGPDSRAPDRLALDGNDPPDTSPEAARTSLPPLSEGTLPWGDPYAGERDALMVPPASSRLGLDIDLSGGEGQAQANEGHVDLPLEPARKKKGAAPAAAAPARPAAGRELPPLDLDTGGLDGEIDKA